jgi:hypothetical protein
VKNNFKKVNLIMQGINILLLMVLIIVTLVIGSSILSTLNKDSQIQNDFLSNKQNDNEVFKIENTYCVMEYPLQWKEYLVHEQIKDGDVIQEKFVCVINDNEYQLFDIYFGAPDLGNFVGYIIKDNEKISVTVSNYGYILDDNRNEDENIIYLSMVDSVRDVLNSISEAKGFIE